MQTPQTSIILWMVRNNLPLGHFSQYVEGGALRRDASRAESYRDKNREKTARAIVNGLSQRSVAERVALEWELFDSLLRMSITSICNEVSHSGNVRKGIALLDQLLGGKIRKHEVGPTERKLVVVDGKLVSTRQEVNLAAARAERAFSSVAKPANYHLMSPQEKRRWSEEAARIRKEAR